MRILETSDWLLILAIASCVGACDNGGNGHSDPAPIELAYVDEFQQISSSPSGSYWRPVVPSGFHALGDYAGGEDDADPPRGFLLVAREKTAGALAHPLQYELAWDRVSGVDIWRPVPPSGYVCLGFVAAAATPSADEIMCVREDLAAPGMVGNTISIGRYFFFGTGASWQVIPADEGGIYLGTFTSTGTGVQLVGETPQPPTEPVFVLDASAVRGNELTPPEVDRLVEKHGPVLWLHDQDEYLLDDPEYVLDYSALVWGLVENERDYASHTFEEHGILDTSAAGLMEDVAEYVETDPDFDDPAFRQYLKIDDDLRPGSLDRARALVHVRPWNWLFTDIQFWLFYPYNGPGRVEACASGIYCWAYQLSRSGRHYGDWEHVTLRFWNSEKELVAVYLSRHAGGEWITRSRFASTLSFERSHPEVFAGFYSHAHYPSAGRHEYERVFQFDYGFGTASADLYDVTNRGHAVPLYDSRVYRIVSSKLSGHRVQMPDWLGFSGRWGQYERLSEVIEGPLGIDLYTNREVGAGPTGPPRKVEWRRGDSSEHWWWTRNLVGNEACFDGIDNDGDEQVDCTDPDCGDFDPLC